jgi:branched-chain amino acid transport system permease protein
MKQLMLIVTFAFFLICPALFYPVFLMEGLCYVLFACSLNLLFGYGGLLSFGHAAFFGSAAYITGYSVKVIGLSPEIGMLAGALISAALGIVIGLLAIRCRGIYFAMITFAMAEMVYFIALQAPFTGGEDGLQSIPRGHLFGLVDLENDLVMYYFVLGVVTAGVCFLYRIVNSPFGQVLRAIRENESRAISLGFNVDRYKLIAFVLSATLSGVAGATKALTFHFASLSEVHWHQSGEVVLMVLLGGLGTFAGPIVGAFFVVTLQHYLAEIGEWVTFTIGAIFVLCVLAFRRGFVGELIPYFYRIIDQIKRSRLDTSSDVASSRSRHE